MKCMKSDIILHGKKEISNSCNVRYDMVSYDPVSTPLSRQIVFPKDMQVNVFTYEDSISYYQTNSSVCSAIFPVSPFSPYQNKESGLIHNQLLTSLILDPFSIHSSRISSDRPLSCVQWNTYH
ncbi:hypothetical protein TNCV_1665331 [Trichonephila clavipes]|nr:hypothetical protein TNCV_1665331 [Trichonephila clavipes]